MVEGVLYGCFTLAGEASSTGKSMSSVWGGGGVYQCSGTMDIVGLSARFLRHNPEIGQTITVYLKGHEIRRSENAFFKTDEKTAS